MVPIDDPAVAAFFAATPAWTTLVAEALPVFQRAFDGQGTPTMRVVQGGDADPLLCITMVLPKTYADDPDEALRAFDEAWWLPHCHLSGGVIVFDYAQEQD